MYSFPTYLTTYYHLRLPGRRTTRPDGGNDDQTCPPGTSRIGESTFPPQVAHSTVSSSKFNPVLFVLDGTEYHGSESIHCPGCSTPTLSNGKTSYHHGALTPVIVARGRSAVFSPPPEVIPPQDGVVKKDCELHAGTRWLQPWGPQIAAWGTTVLATIGTVISPFAKRLFIIG